MADITSSKVNQECPVSILLVDDEFSILKSLERVFMEEPTWTVVSHASAESALAWLSDNSVDVIISDERMPGISGSQFLAQIRKSHPDVPRIILTGQADQAATIRAINDAEVFRFLQKPWDNKELIKTVKEALDHVGAISKQTAIGLQLLKQKNELAEVNKQLTQAAMDTRVRLEKSSQALKILVDSHNDAHKTIIRVILTLVSTQNPELVGLARDILGKVKDHGPSCGITLDQDCLDAALLAGLLADSLEHCDLILGKIPDFQGILQILKDSLEAVNCTGPRGLRAMELPLTSRFIAIVRDYLRFEHKIPGSGKLHIIKNAGRMYDSDLVNTFLKVSS